MNTRKPIVAGKFYPSTKEEIIEMIENIRSKEKIDYTLKDELIIGGVVPHAGYMFSAYEAIHFFELIKENTYDTVIIINPNHTGYGEAISLSGYDYWETPMGKVELDKEFIEKLNFPISNIAHQFEHSGEVMLPFLNYYVNKNIKIIPITLTSQTYENAKKVATQIYKVNQKLNRKILIIASSDFTHYQSPEEGKKQDEIVLNDILNFESKKVYKKVIENKLSICGFGCIITLLEYAKLVTQTPKAKILRKGNSGDVIPSDEVVDYISILVFK